MIHIHTDVENLRFFRDCNGIRYLKTPLANPVAYAMENEHVVGVFYSTNQLKFFYEYNNYKQNLPITLYLDVQLIDEELWERKLKN
jgi:hypothetical protein